MEHQIKFSEMTIQKIIKMANDLDAPLPWNITQEGDALIDANNYQILTVNSGDADWDADFLSLVLVVMNTCGGFKANASAAQEAH